MLGRKWDTKMVIPQATGRFPKGQETKTTPNKNNNNNNNKSRLVFPPLLLSGSKRCDPLHAVMHACVAGHVVFTRVPLDCSMVDNLG